MDNRITIDISPSGNVTIKINAASVKVETVGSDQPVQTEFFGTEGIAPQKPTEKQKAFLMSRGRWNPDLDFHAAHKLIGDIKAEEASQDVSGATGLAAAALLNRNIYKANNEGTPLPWETISDNLATSPEKKKRGRPRKAV